MIPYPHIDPVAIQIGPLAVRWYGLSYVVGIGLLWWLLARRARRGQYGFSEDQVADMVFYGALFGVLGGRIGYILFYNLSQYLHSPLDVFKVWEGGMSFHGGFLGVFAALVWMARRWRMPFFRLADFFVPAVPIGLMCGRIGNFINGELWGRPTGLPWAMVFPDPRAGGIPRHPSQLYEAVFEGALLFALLWWFSRRPRPAMACTGLYLVLYGLARSLIELVREPDEQIGFLWGGTTMGQLLSIPMAVAGAVMLWLAYARRPDGATVRAP
ncbi:MAG: prolipoprotein diacylglyceryl transferase [Gammaproteobacteria bacterium]